MGKFFLMGIVFVAFAFFRAAAADAQTGINCASFSTQQAAQTFYDQHKNDNPNNPDPYNLDTNNNGVACEGLPNAPGATTNPAAATATPAAVSTPTPTTAPSGQTLPNNGVESDVLALSSISLLELGYGMTLAARKLGVRRRAIPLYLLRKFVHAADRGEPGVALSDDIYLVHRSVLDAPRLPYVGESDDDRVMLGFVDDDDEPIVLHRVDETPAAADHARHVGDADPFTTAEWLRMREPLAPVEIAEPIVELEPVIEADSIVEAEPIVESRFEPEPGPVAEPEPEVPADMLATQVYAALPRLDARKSR